jgi:hypothetical protein
MHAAPTAAAPHVPSAPSYGPAVPPPQPQPPFQPSYGPPTAPRPPFVQQQPAWRPQPLPPPRRNKVGKWIGIGVGMVAGLAWLSSCASILQEITDSSESSGSNSSTSGSSSDSSGSPSAEPLPDPTPVTYKGINIPEEYYVRFADSPPKPIAPSEGSSPRYEEASDLYYYDAGGWDNDRLLGSSGEKVVLLNNAQKGSLATCRKETRYTKEVKLAQLANGSQLCVHTSSGHIALVTFKGSAPENDPSNYVSVDITVWRNAEEPSSEG